MAGDANAQVCIRKPSLSVGACEDLGSAGKTFLPGRGNILARFFRHRKGLELRDQHKITTIWRMSCKKTGDSLSDSFSELRVPATLLLQNPRMHQDGGGNRQVND
jgi:hypothetical protein